MTREQAAICEVLDRYMSSSLLRDREEEIVRLHGVSVYELARRIVVEAVNVPVDWSKARMEDGLDAMSAMLNERYPWLDSKARSGLAFGYTVTWK